MSESRSPVLLQLRDGELVSADAVWLSVLRGRVWVTRANDPDDHFLDSGQSIRLPRGRGALIGAEGRAQIMLLKAPSRLGDWRAAIQRWSLRWTPRHRAWNENGRPAAPVETLA